MSEVKYTAIKNVKTLALLTALSKSNIGGSNKKQHIHFLRSKSETHPLTSDYPISELRQPRSTPSSKSNMDAPCINSFEKAVVTYSY